MALEVEYNMDYQYLDLLVCGYRENLLIPVMDRKKAVVSYKPTPAENLRCSLIRPVLPAPEFSQNCRANRNWLQSTASPIAG